jgi:hypothetical protein
VYLVFFDTGLLSLNFFARVFHRDAHAAFVEHKDLINRNPAVGRSLSQREFQL